MLRTTNAARFAPGIPALTQTAAARRLRVARALYKIKPRQIKRRCAQGRGKDKMKKKCKKRRLTKEEKVLSILKRKRIRTLLVMQKEKAAIIRNENRIEAARIRSEKKAEEKAVLRSEEHKAFLKKQGEISRQRRKDAYLKMRGDAVAKYRKDNPKFNGTSDEAWALIMLKRGVV